MAFPVDISNEGIWSDVAIAAAPYIRNGTRYIVALNPTDARFLRVLYSSDPENITFSIVETGSSVEFIQSIGTARVGDIIHIVTIARSGTSLSVQAHEFSMSSNSFDVQNQAVYTATDKSLQPLSCCIGVRSGGEKVIAASGTSVKVMGVDYAHLYYSRDQGGGNWITEIQLGTLDNNDYVAIIGAMTSADRFHMIFHNITSTNMLARTFRSNNTLSAIVNMSTAPNVNAVKNNSQVCPYDSPERVSFLFMHVGGLAREINVVDADTLPTNPTTIIATDTVVNVGGYAIAVDDTDKHSIFAGPTANDIRRAVRTGISYDPSVLVQTGTVGNLYAGIFLDGTIPTIGIVYVDDLTANTPLKYTEVALSAAVFQDLAAFVTALANTSNELKPFRGLDSSVIAQASVVSDVSVTKNLIANLLTEASVVSDLLVGQLENLQSNLLAESFVAADLSRFRNIDTSLQADATFVGNTKVTRNLARTVIARALINADLTAVTVHDLQASLLAEGLLVSDISVTRNLASNLLAVVNLTADLAVSLVVDLQASLLAVANISADVRLLRNLISPLLAEGSINSDLSVNKNLIASLLAESFVSADINVTRNLISNVLATANLVANTKVTRNLHMENAAFAFMTKADLKIDKKLQSNLLATVDIFASLGTLGTVDLMSNLLSTANISADLHPFIGLNSSVNAVSNLIANIEKSKDLNINLLSTASLFADLERVANLKTTLFAFGNVNANLRRALVASILMEAIAEQYLTSSHKMRGQKILQTAVAEQYLDGITKLEQDDSLYSFPWNQDYIELLEQIDVNSPEYQHYLDQIQNANEIIERLREQNKRLRDLGG